MAVENYRSILVASSLSKCLHNIWRKPTLPWMILITHPLQISSQASALVSQAAIVSPGFTWECASNPLCRDSRYFLTCRQLTISYCDNTRGDLIARMKAFLRCYIAWGYVMLPFKMLPKPSLNPAHLSKMVSTFHSQTWCFIMSGDSRIADTAWHSAR